MKSVAVDDVFYMSSGWGAYDLTLYKNSVEVRDLYIEENNDIAFNRVVGQYLSNGTLSGNTDGFVSGITTDANAVGNFEIKWGVATVKTDNYLNAWTTKPIADEQLLAAPVNGHLDPRMYLFFTSLAQASINVDIETE